MPLPLKTGGGAASTTARVQAAGAVTVSAELATTTRRHWAYSNPLAAAAGSDPSAALTQGWHPRPAPVIKGTPAAPFCLYVQIAATTTGPSYYANLDYLEFVNASLYGNGGR